MNNPAEAEPRTLLVMGGSNPPVKPNTIRSKSCIRVEKYVLHIVPDDQQVKANATEAGLGHEDEDDWNYTLVDQQSEDSSEERWNLIFSPKIEDAYFFAIQDSCAYEALAQSPEDLPKQIELPSSPRIRDDISVFLRNVIIKPTQLKPNNRSQSDISPANIDNIVPFNTGSKPMTRQDDEMEETEALLKEHESI